MGYGDEIIGSALARTIAPGTRAAFCQEPGRIVWSRQAHEIYKHNPLVARPGEERAGDLEWIRHAKGCRVYTKSFRNRRWEFNYDFSVRNLPQPQLHMQPSERQLAHDAVGTPFILVESRIKDVSPNKMWPHWDKLIPELLRLGLPVVGMNYSDVTPSAHLLCDLLVDTPSFRHAAALVGSAALYMGPEGGLHHAAAATGTKAVVLFGGFIDPCLTGYAQHHNIFTTDEACGNVDSCAHCREAMQRITVDMVVEAARGQLS